MVEYLNGESFLKEKERLLELSKSDQKFWYHTRPCTYHTVTVMNNETHIYWGSHTHKPRYNNGLFFTKHAESGITYDKKAKTVKFWYGKHPATLLITHFEESFRTERWKSMINHVFKHYFGVAYANAVVKGKINTPDDYANFFSKKTLMFKGIDPQAILKCLYIKKDLYINLIDIAHMLQIAKDPLAVADWLTCNSNDYYNTHIYNKAMALDIKIDYNDYDNEVKRIMNEYELKNKKFYGEASMLPF